jgi:hypothetical protein
MRGWIRRGPRYSTMKTVRHDIWGPVEISLGIDEGIEERTQVLDVYGTLVPDASVMDCCIGSVGDCGAIAAFCDSQTVDIEL